MAADSRIAIGGFASSGEVGRVRQSPRRSPAPADSHLARAPGCGRPTAAAAAVYSQQRTRCCLWVCASTANSTASRIFGANAQARSTTACTTSCSGDATCPGVDADPKLGPPRDNGGPTQTIALGAAAPRSTWSRPAPGVRRLTSGVARPHGTGCDAGADQLAPPSISGASATPTSPTTATVKATVVRTFRHDCRRALRHDHRVCVRRARADAGAAKRQAPVAIPLSGLAPGAAYHAQLVVTNADGASRSADLVFTTPRTARLRPVAPSLSQIPSIRAPLGRRQQTGEHQRPAQTARCTTFSFEINETATVKFVFTQRRAGRTVDRRCVARTRRDARSPRCIRPVIDGALAFTAHAGVDKVPLRRTPAPAPQAQTRRAHRS